MSSKKTAQRRIGLMAGSSLVAAFAFTGAALAPTAALADDECGAQAGTTPIVCSATTYFPDVTYDADGDLVITFTASPTTEVGAEGINLTGDGTESITFDSATTNTELESRDTVGPLLDVSTVDGDITIMTEEMDADGQNPAGVTHAIRAISTGAGDISITATNTVDAQGSNPAEAIGIEARSGGGDIAITTSTSFLSVAGEAYGILAETTGSGSLNLDINGNLSNNGNLLNSGGVSSDNTNGIATVMAITENGNIDISVNSNVIGRLRGIAAEASGSGDITLDMAGNIAVNGSVGVAAIDTTAGTGSTTINITSGTINGGAGMLIRAASASTVDVNNTGSVLSGGFDFSGVTGGVIFTNSGTGLLRLNKDSVFGSGADTLNFESPPPGNVAGNALAEGFSIDFGAGDDVMNIVSSFEIGGPAHFGSELGGSLSLGATVAFGDGTDTINNSGAFGSEGPISVTGLEAFNNSGEVYLGPIDPQFVDPQFGDLNSHDVLTMPGATFTGLDGSRLIAAVDFGGASQESCAAPTEAGDCLYLPGGATAGMTLIDLIGAGDPATPGAYNTAVTVVDVAGGTSAAGHFTIDPDSVGYIIDPTYGGVIDRPGLFVYALRYDAADQRHVVTGLPRSETFEYAMLSSAAQSIWHMTTETVTDRQADLRAAPETGALWMRTTGEYSKRDVANSIDAFGDTYNFDQSYSLYAGTIMGGLDLIQGRSGDLDYVVGVQIGYVGSSFELDNSPSSGHFSGATGGIYGSIWNDHVFLDATFNMNGLTLDHDSPATGTKTNTYTTAFGGRLEGGMRYKFSEIFFAEPLVTLSFVRTGFEEISLFGGEVLTDDAQSRRAALGLRVGGDIDGQIVNWSYFLTGRAWNEFDGESTGIVDNPGLDLPFMDEFDGNFGQVEAGLSLYNDANTLSGFASSGVKWMDGYSAIDLSLGLRMAW